MTGDADSRNEKVGFRRPPTSTQFPKGRSGNPKGRPKGRHKELPYESVLGQMVTIREDGVERRVTAEEAFLLQLAKRGLEGDGPATRLAMDAIETARLQRLEANDVRSENSVLRIVSPGRVNGALEMLGMARKLNRYSENARMALEPWLVEAALDRLGNRRLTLREQEIVVEATRTPKKVRWPDWWEIEP